MSMIVKLWNFVIYDRMDKSSQAIDWPLDLAEAWVFKVVAWYYNSGKHRTKEGTDQRSTSRSQQGTGNLLLWYLGK